MKRHCLYYLYIWLFMCVVKCLKITVLLVWGCSLHERWLVEAKCWRKPQDQKWPKACLRVQNGFRRCIQKTRYIYSKYRMITICQLYLPEHLCIGHVVTLAVSDLSFQTVLVKATAHVHQQRGGAAVHRTIQRNIIDVLWWMDSKAQNHTYKQSWRRWTTLYIFLHISIII